MTDINQANGAVQSDGWVVQNPPPLAAPSISLPGISVLLLALLVVVTLLGGGLLHWQVGDEIHRRIAEGAPQAMQQRFDRLWAWQLNAMLFTAASGVVLIWIVMTGFKRIRQRWDAQWAERADEWTIAVGQLRAQLTERRSVEAGLLEQQSSLRSKLQEMTKSHAQVSDELNRIKLAEEVFTHQKRELVRSKDVLELHVQARTQELQKLQRAYESILNSAGEGICGLDAVGRVTFANPTAAKMLGMLVQEMAGQPASLLFPAFSPSKSSGGEQGGPSHPEEVVATRRDGTLFGAEYLRTPIHEDGRVIGEVLLFKDITERKEAAETLARKAAELARSNAELEQFAFVASHDLQEPLRKIQAFGDRLKTKCAAVNLEEGRDYLERMQGAAARMQTLIYDLLTFSRMIRRTEPFVAVDLGRVAREVIGDLEVLIEKTGGQVEIGDLPSIEADALQMHQLLLNLVGNALKFHAPGVAPKVHICAAMPEPGQPQFCEITVSDNGIGFDEKYLDRIFAVFQRLHGRQEYEGTGIGLAVCRRIVDRHCGTIAARSKPGEGAAFIVRLPLRHEAKQKGAP